MQLSSSRSESNASKDQAVLWFKQFKAFDKVKPNKSYAPALVSNVSVNAFAYPRAEMNLGVTDKLKPCIVGNNQC